MTDYQNFLRNKHLANDFHGFDVPSDSINPTLFDFQRDIVRWALKLGRAALFEECGLGKTRQFVEWANHVTAYTGGRAIILTPLAVAPQVVEEGCQIGVRVEHRLSSDEMRDERIVVTNYERLHLFNPDDFVGVVLDESSILKNFTGKTKQRLISAFAETPYRLCSTATPAPNDYLEFGNHAEFLGVMPSNEMIARWFINNTKKAGDYRLKKHAEADFWRWITSWAVSISTPGDIGDQYAMPGYDLPELCIHEHYLDAPQESIARAQSEGRLMPDTSVSSTNMHKVKRESLLDRVAQARAIYATIPAGRPVVIWCDTNYEADALQTAFPEAIEVRGDMKDAEKEARLTAFTRGEHPTIITKPSIAGLGLNWQHCADMIFVGVSYSFEALYQAIRRSYRFGQSESVNAHLIYAETEGNILNVVKEKQQAFRVQQAAMSQAMREHGLFRSAQHVKLSTPAQRTEVGQMWEMHQGDCVPFTQSMPDDSIHFSVYSPPFRNLYIYSDSEADMGNSSTMEEFLTHYSYLIRELYRVTLPGRLTAVHVKDLPIYKNSAEWFGIEDFSGLVSTMHRQHGWIFHSRITIWKNPVDEMEKTNSHGLLHKNFSQRAQVVRTGLPDYLMVFAKPDPQGMGEDVKQLRIPGDYIGESTPQPHHYLNSLRQRTPNWYPGSVDQYNYSIAVWQRYASPVWFDIDMRKTLNYHIAKGDKDEKHIAPLQYQVAQRAIDIWTNPGERVFSPFGGIGTEPWSAVGLKRYGIGVELKTEYFEVAVTHLRELEDQPITLWEYAEQRSEVSVE